MKKLLLLAFLAFGLISNAQDCEGCVTAPFDIKLGLSNNFEFTTGVEFSYHKVKPQWYLSLAADVTKLETEVNSLTTILVGPRLYTPITNGKIQVHPYVGYRKLIQGHQTIKSQNFYFTEIGNKFLLPVNYRAQFIVEINRTFGLHQRTRIGIGLKTHL